MSERNAILRGEENLETVCPVGAYARCRYAGTDYQACYSSAGTMSIDAKVWVLY